MHTYRQHAGRWEVILAFAGVPPVHIRNYDTEAQSASWASYLNGGSLPENAAYGSNGHAPATQP